MPETNDVSSPLSEHLEELRQHLLLPFTISILCIVLFFPFTTDVINQLVNLANLKIEDMAVFNPTEFLRLKLYLSLFSSILVTHPLWYRGFYNFSKPGLNDKEKKIIVYSLSLGSILFIIGASVGLLYLSPFLIEFLLEENNQTSTSLSIYQTIKALIAVSIFSGFLASLPVLILTVNKHTTNTKTLKKYTYILIIIVITLGTPEPSMIINLIFLVFFAAIMEVTLLFTESNNAN